MIHEVDADRPVHTCLKRYAKLCAHAVGACNQDGIVQLCGIEPEEPAEGPDVGEHAGGKRSARKRADPSYDLVTGLDVDASLFVIHQKSSVWMRVSASFRAGLFSGAAQYPRRTVT